jgi:hypothetical protein
MSRVDQEIVAPLSFLEDLPRYETEKPYYALLRPPVDFDVANATSEQLEALPVTNNLDFCHKTVPLLNIRGRESDFKLEECGFEVKPHTSAFVDNVMTVVDAVSAYQRETESLLQERFNAEHTCCFEARVCCYQQTTDK